MSFPANSKALRAQTNLGNWRTAPYNRWAFHNVRQIVPSAAVHAAEHPSPLAYRPRDFSNLQCEDRYGVSRSFDEVLQASHTDAVVVMHEGSIAHERYFNGMRARDPHILMSVSKSVVATLAGILMEQGVLDADAEVSEYIPELQNSGFAGATLQQVLDMRTGIDFDEDYYVSSGLMIEYREVTGWNPLSADTPPGGLHDFLLRLQANRPHGGDFQYTSPNSDLLGWILERTTGESLADLLSDLVWQPMGAEFEACITVDRHGASRAAGGISTSLRDLARLGLTMQQHGLANGRNVLPAWWVHETSTGGDRQAWANGNFQHLLPDGNYRNKWYQYGNDLDAYCGIGIHGQFLYVAPQAAVVIAHFGSHPEPFNAAAEAICLDAFDSIARACAG